MSQARRSTSVRAMPVVMVVLAGAFAGPDASAQGWMAGGSVGTAPQYDYEGGAIDQENDDVDPGYRVFGGYLFTPIVGAAISYVDLGSLTLAGSAFGGFTDEIEADAVDLSFLAGWAPGSQKLFRLFGTVGYFHFSQDVHHVDPSGVYDYSDSGWSFSYGGGVEFSLNAAAKWGIHLNYQRFTDVGDADNSGHEYDRSFIAVGFNYRFGK